ncbi:MAG: hypothetical protein O2843_02065, partial [Chloroflexi bacterium]|nr:hypothetical protein [Chloroflexota bacterium]
ANTPAPTSALTERTLRRRATWDSHAEAATYLRARAPYDSWDRDVFAAWMDTGVTEQGGQFALSCPPWVEASVFAETGGSTAADDVERVRVPTWIARATGDRGMRSTCPDTLAGQIPGTRETVIDGSGHFLPLEDVALVERLVGEALDHVAAVGRSALASEAAP